MRRAPRHRHRVHGRGPLPAAALPRADRSRRRRGRRGRHRPRPAHRGDRPRAAGRRPRRPRRRGRAPRRAPGRLAAARDWGRPVRGVFDTQLAAGFAGMRAQLGYEPLLKEVLGVRLRKSASFTRWDNRPLTDEQLGYAREDVLHLLAARRALQERLGTWAAWSGHARSAAPSRRSTTAATSTRSSPAAPGQLAGARPARRRPGARALARGHRPAPATAPPRPSSTTPRSWRSPSAGRASERLRQIRGLNESTFHRRGKAIVEAVERGRERAPIPVEGVAPDAARPRGRAAHRPRRGTRAHAGGRGRAGLRARRGAGRPAAHRDRRCARAPEPEVRTLQGWRRELVGDELLELLDGRRSLRVGSGLDAAGRWGCLQGTVDEFEADIARCAARSCGCCRGATRHRGRAGARGGAQPRRPGQPTRRRS